MTKAITHAMRDERGGSMVEFAIVAPVLALLCFGAADFGRLFVESAVLAGAANAGAYYGYRTNPISGDDPGVRQMVLDDSTQLQGVTATYQRVCDCPDAPGTLVDCITASCPNYGPPRMYVRAGAQKQFDTIVKYPGIPGTVNLDLAGYMRVQ